MEAFHVKKMWQCKHTKYPVRKCNKAYTGLVTVTARAIGAWADIPLLPTKNTCM